MNDNIIINIIHNNYQSLSIIIKDMLNSTNFGTIKKGIEFVNNMISLNNVDINLFLLNSEIIKQLITINLLNENEPESINKILNGIFILIENINKYLIIPI